MEFYSALYNDEDSQMGVDQLDPEGVRDKMKNLSKIREDMLQEVKVKVEASRERKRNAKTIPS